MASPPLVVGVDGSEPSIRAAEWAADEAVRHGLPLRLVYASLWQRYEGAALAARLSRPDGQVMAENILGATAERIRLRAPDLHVTTDVPHEDAVDALLREGAEAFALVTGSRGRGEFTGLLLGSVSLAVAARAHVPAVVVRGDKAGLDGAHGRILLGVGDTDVDSAAVRFAFAEALLRRCELDVVRAWRCPSHETADHPLLADDSARYHEAQASELLDEALAAAAGAHPGVPVRRVVTEGPARKVLTSRSAVADLLVVGAHRRHRQFGMQLGRVAHTVLHHAACPVAVVPDSESASEGTVP
ncbi:universal stress protein [Streptomyces sp. HB132]|uniref:universal stress protein n=1 Tax=Streptomyces sp. HB132 TaxID=767388 RepID=UPI001962053D|nr:universal stress protein [Streptomyces sp. HB132]MBM7440246.1 nucleotide-binding universal stress UspA family protein [Streptomyces sp. HB132]